MDIKLINQYYSLLKGARFGLDLSFKSVFNYLIYTCLKPSDKINLSCTPPLVTVYVTRRCNLKCDYCLESKVDKNSKYEDYELTQERYIKILEHPLVKKSLLINFCGGEPLLNKNICELVSITKKYKKIACLVTNGTLLKNKWEQLLKSRIDDIQVSIYNHTFNTFGDIFKYINKDKKLNASYVLLRNDLRNNPQLIENVVSFVNDSGFKSLKINLCSSSKFNNFIDELVREDDLVKYEKLKNKILKKYKNMKIFFPKVYESNTEIVKKCRLPWSVLQVDAKGHYGVCCVHNPDTLGNDNILDGDWNSIINCKDFCDWRKILLSKNNIIPEQCKECYHLIGSYSSNL